jgi:hypothetical protein
MLRRSMGVSRRSALLSLAAIVVVAIAVAGLGALQKAPTTIAPEDPLILPARGYYMGVLPTPAGGQSLDDAYRQAKADAELVPIWGRPSPFYQLADDLSGSWGKAFVETLVRGNGMIPLVHMSFIGPNMTLIAPPGMQNATLGDPAWRKAYKEAALAVVKASKPLFLSLGNEVNRWYERYGAKDGDPNSFRNFVSLYNEIYDAVKGLSPQTQVFCTFAREVVSQNREADLSVLSFFDRSKMDLLVFTSYPFSVAGVNSPSDIPDDYYSRALGYMPGKAMGFSELGWSADSHFGGEAGQAQFLAAVVGRLTEGQGVQLRFVCWAWLHDLSAEDRIGLIGVDGTERMAYRTWKALSHPSG